ncbi:glyoxylase I family protein [Saccharopolyspora phatthalungensis]|uniref:Glyoxylase I family protein n=1 Tax=Saccharopolyspora phatthalungensis TaxID=664693 RepID=A0A840QF07_9PSEU|nr:glyoxylase I family protein [Saccharopolyspora phatthalungensis]
MTVPDLEQAREFFVDVLGCEYLYTLGPLRDDGGRWMSEHLNVDDRAVAQRIQFFRIGGRAILEVFEYEAPAQRQELPRNSDIGGHHLAFYVADLDAAVADLRRRGLRVLGEPTKSKGPHEGQRWIYFLSPWGLQCELVSYPHGKAFDRDPDAFR